MEKKWTCAKCGKLNEADARRCYFCDHFLNELTNYRVEHQTVMTTINNGATGKSVQESEPSIETFKKQYEEALRHDKLPFLTGTTRVAMQWIIGCALFVFFWFVADQLIFRESFSRSTLGTEIILFLSTMASYSIVKALFGGLK